MENLQVQNFPTSQIHAMATTDIGFKKLTSLNHGCDKTLLLTLLNTFITVFREDPVVDVVEVPTKLSAAAHVVEKLTFADYEATTSQRVSYFIEIQSQQDAVVEESALFHWCGAYTRQLSMLDKKPPGSEWYTHLKPVIILQFCNFGSETNPKKYSIHCTTRNEYIKHYALSEKTGTAHSGEVEHLHVVQIDLSRAEAGQLLFPPPSISTMAKESSERSTETTANDSTEDITIPTAPTGEKPLTFSEWWMSILLHAHQYTNEKIDALTEKQEIPLDILQAFKQLNMNEWNPLEKAIYLEELVSSNVYQTLLLQERCSGRRQGMIECAMKLLQGKTLSRDSVKAVLGLNDVEMHIVDTMVSFSSTH